MQTILFLLLVLACPIGMMLMMRGGHRTTGGQEQDADPAAQERRIVNLEQEIARLRDARAARDAAGLVGPRQ